MTAALEVNISLISWYFSKKVLIIWFHDIFSISDDEVEFLEAVEVQRHFFGVDFNDFSSSNNIINDDSSDPFAEIPDKSSVVSPSLEESSIKKPIEEDDDAGVFILSWVNMYFVFPHILTWQYNKYRVLTQKIQFF